MWHHSRRRAAAAVALLALTGACGGSGSVNPGGDGTIKLTVLASPVLNPSGASGYAGYSTAAGGHTLLVDSVALSLDAARIRRDGAGDVSILAVARTAPITLKGAGGRWILRVLSPTGSYDDFRANVTTVDVHGAWDGTPFQVSVPVNATFSSSLSGARTLSDGGTLHLSLALDPRGWFASGGSLIDPTTLASSPAALATVRASLLASLAVIEDANENGIAGD